MAKKKTKKRSGLWFALGMFVYALVFLGAVAYGLKYLWGILEEFEAKETYEEQVTGNPIDEYMAGLTLDRVLDAATPEVYATLNQQIQTEEECRQMLASYLTGDFTRAKVMEMGTTSDSPQIRYDIYCGTHKVGRVTTASRIEERYGFTVWEVTDETFDLTNLVLKEEMMGQVFTVTVPHDHTVSVNGIALDESYIIESDRQYEVLAEFYEDYELPTIVTYQAGPFMGDVEPVITNPAGEVVTIDENTDWNSFLNNCSEGEISEIQEFLEDFLASYVKFTSSRDNRFEAYRDVITYMVKNGALADRMKRALDGLQYNHIRNAYLLSVTQHHCVNIGNDRYMVDLTYVSNVDKYAGYYEETINLKVILVRTDSGLRAEAMTIY